MTSAETKESAYLSSERTFKESCSLRSLFPPMFWSNPEASHTYDDDYLNESTSATKTDENLPKGRIMKQENEKTDLIRVAPLVSGLGITESKDYNCSQHKKSVNSIRAQIVLPIDTSILRKICFNESLIISRKTKTQLERKRQLTSESYPHLLDVGGSYKVGGIRLCVQQSAGNIIVDSATQFSYEGSEARSSIVSLINNHFESIEEKKTETLLKVDGKQEKILHVFRDRSQYVSFCTWVKRNYTHKRRRRIFNFQRQGDLILDGAGLALMRYLVFNKFEGDLETLSLNINGRACRVIYNIGKQKTTTIDGRTYNTICIMKRLFPVNGRTEISKTYFLPTGHLVHHFWENCPYFIHSILPKNYLSTGLETTPTEYIAQPYQVRLCPRLGF